MPVLVPTGNQPIPDGYVNPPNIIYEGTLATGDILTFGLASASKQTCQVNAFDLDLWETSISDRIINRAVAWNETNVLVTYTANRVHAIKLVLLVGGNDPTGCTGVAIAYHAEVEHAQTTYCQYGTQPKPLATFIYYLTPELILAWCVAVGHPELAIFLTPLWFTTWDAVSGCGSGPPPVPTLPSDPQGISVETAKQLLQVVAWPTLCECKAGTPSPIPYPPPAITPPTGLPQPITFSCSNTDVCAALVQIQQALASIGATLGQNYQLTTLEQRYGQPFAYIRGATHSNISGSGSFAVSRLIGMQVAVTQRPQGLQEFLGAPTYITDLGWISLMTADGMIDEIRLTRDVQTWTPRLFGLATQFGFALREGVTVSLTELEAEP